MTISPLFFTAADFSGCGFYHMLARAIKINFLMGLTILDLSEKTKVFFASG